MHQVCCDRRAVETVFIARIAMVAAQDHGPVSGPLLHGQSDVLVRFGTTVRVGDGAEAKGQQRRRS